MSRVVEYLKRLVRREPVRIRNALGAVITAALVTLHVDPAYAVPVLAAVWIALTEWARAKVSPVERP